MFLFSGKNRVTSGYRLSDRPDHNGIDIVGEDSNLIRCPVFGTVMTSIIVTDKNDLTWEWGNFVRVDDNAGNRYFFCHMAERRVKVGDKVNPGTILGVMGNTGYSTGPHTHFEARKADNVTRLDPAKILGIPNAKGVYEEKPSDIPSGWIKASGNRWQYSKNGKLLKSEWLHDTDGYWYFLGADTYMVTGLQEIAGKLYFFNPARKHNIPTGACIITDGSGAIKRK